MTTRLCIRSSSHFAAVWRTVPGPRKSSTGRRGAGWKRFYYVCGRHTAGSACRNAAHLFADVAERQIAGYLVANVLPQIEAEIRAEIRAEIKRAAETRTADVDILAAEIARLKAEQRRLASAIATTDEPIPELIERMKANRDTLRRLESNHAIASAPAIDDVTARRIEGAAVAHLARLRDLLVGDRAMLRDSLKAIFPSGLQLVTDGNGGDCGPWAEGEASSNSVRFPDSVRVPGTGYRTTSAVRPTPMLGASCGVFYQPPRRGAARRVTGSTEGRRSGLRMRQARP